jgi:hypothetical protein
MKTKKMETFISNFDYNDLIKFEEIYSEKKKQLLSEYWTIETISDELSSYVDCYMNDYLESIGEENYYPPRFEHKLDLDPELFLKFLGVYSIEWLLDSLFNFELNREYKSINEFLDFSWEDYCKYYHDRNKRNDKIDLIVV